MYVYIIYYCDTRILMYPGRRFEIEGMLTLVEFVPDSIF